MPRPVYLTVRDADISIHHIFIPSKELEVIKTVVGQSPTAKTSSNRVFIVHGRDELHRYEITHFVETLGLNPIILDEQANRGRTVIEKFESHTDVEGAIILYTPDDLGNLKEEAQAKLNPRARQNVVFEHGYLMAKLGRNRVIMFVNESAIELPSDIQGIVYIANTDWKHNLTTELLMAGFEINPTRIPH